MTFSLGVWPFQVRPETRRHRLFGHFRSNVKWPDTHAWVTRVSLFRCTGFVEISLPVGGELQVGVEEVNLVLGRHLQLPVFCGRLLVPQRVFEEGLQSERVYLSLFIVRSPFGASTRW